MRPCHALARAARVPERTFRCHAARAPIPIRTPREHSKAEPNRRSSLSRAWATHRDQPSGPSVWRAYRPAELISRSARKSSSDRRPDQVAGEGTGQQLTPRLRALVGIDGPTGHREPAPRLQDAMRFLEAGFEIGNVGWHEARRHRIEACVSEGQRHGIGRDDAALRHSGPRGTDHPDRSIAAGQVRARGSRGEGTQDDPESLPPSHSWLPVSGRRRPCSPRRGVRRQPG